MSLLVDPAICPDCRARLDADAVCTGCGLRLRGPLATQLWSTMQAADRLVEQLRAGAQPVPVPPSPPPTAPAPTAPAVATAGAPARRLPALSVQVGLLGLGALLLLVAAVVFVAVAWSDLGLGGRALILLGITTVLGASAGVLTRRGLRGAAETFWMVVALMLTLDLASAHTAGLLGLGALSWRGATALVGGGLLLVGLGAPLWARTQPVRRLVGPQFLAVLGGALVVVPGAWLAHHPAPAISAAVVVLVGAGLLLRPRVAVAAHGLVGLGAVTWVVLLGLGVARAVEAAGPGWWHSATGWPLVAAAVLAGAASVLPGRGAMWRGVGAAGCLAAVGVAVHGPTTNRTASLLLLSAVLALYALVARFAARPWSRAAAVLALPLTVGLGAALALRPPASVDLEALGRLGVAATVGRHATPLESWRYLVLALALLLVAAAADHLLSRAGGGRQRLTRAAGPGVLLVALLVPALEARGPLWLAVVELVVALVLSTLATLRQRTRLFGAAAGGAVTAYLLGLLLLVAAGSHLLSAVAVGLVALALLAAYAVAERARPGAPATAAAAALGVALAAYAVAQAVAASGGDRDVVAVALAVVAAVVGVGAAWFSRSSASRVALEAVAGVVAVAACTLTGDDATLAVALTVVGTAVAVVAVLHRDRALAGWAAMAVLGLATLVRVGADVRAPELYTLPAALLLLGAGLWRVRSDPSVSSVSAVGSGLTLALLPSLLLTWDDPASLRGLLLGLGALTVLAVGVRLRLAAPFAAGALVTALLACRHLEPVAFGLPRWIGLGTVGLALLVVGITWEARLKDLRRARGYVGGLR